MIRTLVAFLIALLLVAAPGYAFQRFGIVLLHGKTGTPAQFAVLADNLADLGYLVETPEMCWSASRIYDRSFTGCFEDIDAAIDRLNADGAEGIVVAGHSLGGVGALAYGASHDGLAGVIALAPAGDPVRFASVPAIALSMARARRAVAAGDGDTTITLDDFVLGHALPVRATPSDFLTFFGTESPGALGRTLPAQRAPLLAGTRDNSQRNAKTLFADAPARPASRFVRVNAGHLGKPGAAFDVILQWLDVLEDETGR